MRWLTLLMTLPPSPTRHRVGVWRKLQRMGAVRLRGAGWILPETAETTERFQWLVQEIESVRGEATLLRVDRVEPMTDDELSALFHKARGAEYQAVIHGCREVLSRVDSRVVVGTALAKLRTRLDAQKRELDRIAAVDYLPHRSAGAPRPSGRRWPPDYARRKRGRARPAEAGAGRCRRAERSGSRDPGPTSIASPPPG